MRKRWLLMVTLAFVLLVTGLAEAHGPYPMQRPWSGHHPRTAFSFDLHFVAPLHPYPHGYYAPVYVLPPGYAPPVFVPRCTIYSTPGYYRQVPWYTEGGFTTFRQEWVPPTTTQACW